MGSVHVPVFLAVESYATVRHVRTHWGARANGGGGVGVGGGVQVHQLVTTVRGQLESGNTAIDAFRSAFPPG